jgi:TonB family protein
MLKGIAAASLLLAALSAAGQTAGSQSQGLPTDPREIFKAAAPFYDFNDPALKPWHMKAHYQLYDALGKPGETGTFEYWWASPKVHRSTWTRASASRSEWSTADGKLFSEESRGNLHYFEFQIPQLLFGPLPPVASLDNPKSTMMSEIATIGGVQFPCGMPVPAVGQVNAVGTVPPGSFPTYCFDPKAPVLRIINEYSVVSIVFDRIEKMQGHYLPQEVRVTEAGQIHFTVAIDDVTSLDPADTALTPSDHATASAAPIVFVASGVAEGALIKKVPPKFPLFAQSNGRSGRVLLAATIGPDGSIHSLEVITSDAPYFTSAALDAVSQWKYRPYLLNGQPVEAHTIIQVFFTMRR